MARIRLREWAANNGVALGKNLQGNISLNKSPELLAILEKAMYGGTCPCLCDECDDVELDGRCEHGAPSLLIACGMI